MEYAQKLLSTRRGSIYLAAIAALLAGAVILVYLNQYRDELQTGGTPVTVLVARSTIPRGTSADVIASRRLFTATTLRESQLREGAISDVASLRGKVATAEIYEGARVDVYAGFNVIPITPDGRPTAGGQARPVLRLIMENIPVVAVEGDDGGMATASDRSNVSLRVDDQQAAKLTFAADN